VAGELDDVLAQRVMAELGDGRQPVLPKQSREPVPVSRRGEENGCSKLSTGRPLAAGLNSLPQPIQVLIERDGPGQRRPFAWATVKSFTGIDLVSLGGHSAVGTMIVKCFQNNYLV